MALCKGCKHWLPRRQGNMKQAGECRRHAPRPETSGAAVTETQWPVTLEDSGCAEFEAGKAPKPDAAPSEAQPAAAAAAASASPAPKRTGKRKAK